MGDCHLPGLSDEYFALVGEKMPINTQESLCIEGDIDLMASMLSADTSSSQFDSQTSRWLQMSLVPRKYDIEMLNALLGVFLKHIARTFQSFENFEITSHTVLEQILAMAAVGSLFVTSKGSTRISRMLYTDCNRLLSNHVSTLYLKIVSS